MTTRAIAAGIGSNRETIRQDVVAGDKKLSPARVVGLDGRSYAATSAPPAARELIAGGRRLAAVRSLGWVRMPVTVAELSTVEELLRAEADENTQRKALTGTEALAAAERREKILAEMARERQRQAPGEARGVKVSGGNLPQQSATETGKTRDLAAVGTGFSATSLRKVAVVRDAAEAETVRHGGRDVPVPEPVRAVARASPGWQGTGPRSAPPVWDRSVPPMWDRSRSPSVAASVAA